MSNPIDSPTRPVDASTHRRTASTTSIALVSVASRSGGAGGVLMGKKAGRRRCFCFNGFFYVKTPHQEARIMPSGFIEFQAKWGTQGKKLASMASAKAARGVSPA